MTGSRDTYVKVWREESPGSRSFVDAATLKGHSDFVSAVCWCQEYKDITGAVLSGSRDCQVILWDVEGALARGEDAQPLIRMDGHKYQVTGVAVLENGALVSGSLDSTLRVWDAGACSNVLDAHKGPVLCVLALPDSGGSVVVSGSGDCTIRLWDVKNTENPCTCIMEGHHDSVRSIAYVSGIGLVSGSHDTTVKVWTLDGMCLQTMQGHTALVYSVAVNDKGTLIASGSEDNTARLWNLNGECLQVIEHPGCVWGVAFLPNGDLVTACADGVARVWTQEEGKVASREVIKSYEHNLNRRKEQEGGKVEGGVQESAIPMHDPSVLDMPGSHDGQTIVVRQGQSGMAYSWNHGESKWEMIGEVMSAPNPMHASPCEPESDAFDFIFDVDIADNMPPLKLKANVGDNAYAVADGFIAENDLPTSYREQIVDFLSKNTQGRVNTSVGMSNVVPDPYTGASAYVPSTSTMGDSQPIAYNADPYTGTESKIVSKFPITYFSFFTSPLSISNARKKIEEFNATVESEIPDKALTELDWHDLDKLMNVAIGQAKWTKDIRPSFLGKIFYWPASSLFPFLDIFRVLLLNTTVVPVVREILSTIGPQPLHHSFAEAFEVIFSSPDNDVGKIALLRLLNNAFGPGTISTVGTNLRYVFSMVKGCSQSKVKGIQISYSALLLNSAVFLVKTVAQDAQIALEVIIQANDMLTTFGKSLNETARKNILMALGTILCEYRSLKRTIGATILNLEIFNSTIGMKAEEEEFVRDIIKMLVDAK